MQFASSHEHDVSIERTDQGEIADSSARAARRESPAATESPRIRKFRYGRSHGVVRVRLCAGVVQRPHESEPGSLVARVERTASRRCRRLLVTSPFTP